MTTPYQRLMQEAIPTRPPAKPPHEPWTPEEQAKHVADLLAALKDWRDPSPTAQRDRERDRHRRHLRLISNSQQTDAA
jgi:hypothetical protein